MSRYFRQFQHLLPRSEAWRTTVEKQLRQFFEALGESPTGDAVEFVDDVWLDIFPQTTRELELWETQFALSGTGTEQERRDILEARWQAQGGQDPRYIQDILQVAGFPVYVHEWWSGDGVTYVDSPNDIFLGGSLAAEEVWLKPDGTSLFFVANTLDLVIRWDMSTAYDISTAAASGVTADISAEETGGKGLAMSRDGLRVYVYGDTRLVHQYDLGTAWDLTTMGFTPGDLFDTSAEVDTRPEGIEFTPDGMSLFVAARDAGGDGRVFRYNLATPWDVKTASYSGDSLDTSTQSVFLASVRLADSGFTLWVGEDGGNKILRYDMTHQYDITTATFTSEIDPSMSNPVGLAISDDSKNMYILDRNFAVVDQYWRNNVKDPRDYTEQPALGLTQCGDTLAECGEQPPDQVSESSAVCSALLANDTGYLVNDDLTRRPPPRVPDDPATWPYFLYFGGATFPAKVDIFDYQRADFERLLLQICPAQQWLVVRVNYIATPLTGGSPITYIV